MWSLGYEKLLNFACDSMKFNNCHNASTYALALKQKQSPLYVFLFPMQHCKGQIHRMFYGL